MALNIIFLNVLNYPLLVHDPNYPLSPQITFCFQRTEGTRDLNYSLSLHGLNYFLLDHDPIIPFRCTTLTILFWRRTLIIPFWCMTVIIPFLVFDLNYSLLVHDVDFPF